MIWQTRIHSFAAAFIIAALASGWGALAVSTRAPLLAETAAQPYPSITPDIYEPDDPWQRAQNLYTVQSYIRQFHNFHDATDEDWLTFSAPGGYRYVCDMRAYDLGAQAYATLALYDVNDLATPLRVDNGKPEARIYYESATIGSYYLRASPNDATATGVDSNYKLTIACPYVMPPPTPTPPTIFLPIISGAPLQPGRAPPPPNTPP